MIAFMPVTPPDPLPPGLYIVATPIGNLGDLTPRAAGLLARADVLLVEDSRVTAKLLRHIGVRRPMVAYHDHNADRLRPELVERMSTESVALVSDAGTPLISDPGYKLVREARAAGRMVTTAPGASAAIAALTLAGLPTDRFLFLGFLPPKDKARADALREVAGVRATLVLYESGPRLAACLQTLAAELGDRPAAVVREITKAFEEAVTGTLAELAARYGEAAPRGEIVVVIGPPGEAAAPEAEALDAMLRDALQRLPVGQAAGAVARSTGLARRELYARAQALRDEEAGA
jgi:16S rRNA (cytidine1402-2'-O)-methyltransferase